MYDFNNLNRGLLDIISLRITKFSEITFVLPEGRAYTRRLVRPSVCPFVCRDYN